MQFLEIPELPLLRGKEAIEALNEYIVELSQDEECNLKEHQKAALIKIAQGLISSIEAETQVHKETRKPHVLTLIRRAFGKYDPRSIREAPDTNREKKATLFTATPYSQICVQQLRK